VRGCGRVLVACHAFAEEALVQVLPKEDVNPESKMKCMREVVALDKDHINVSPL